MPQGQHPKSRANLKLGPSASHARGRHPNSLANLKRGVPFKKGVSIRPALGLSLREWWRTLAAQREDGTGIYSVAQLRAIAEADENDTKIPVVKRIAAQRLIEATMAGRVGREAFEALLDRVEGKAHQIVHVTAHRAEDDPAVEISEATLAKIQAAALPALPPGATG